MIFLYLLLLLLGAVAAALAWNTWHKTRAARALTGEHPKATEETLGKYAEALGRMIRCKTVSVKDHYDDTEFAKLRAEVRELFPLLHEKAERMSFADDCWVYKIPGKDQSRNILLMSHHDVVAVDETWTHEPFGGQVEDGILYGRGAADTKGSLCAILFAVEELLKEGVVPPVNLYVASSHNEELGGDGITSARAWFQEQGIRFEVVLDEGGAIVDPPLGNMKCEMCAMVAVHEKGRCRVKCTAASESNHVSLTGFRGNPVERMASFVQEVTTHKIFLRKFDPRVREMFDALAPYCAFPMNVLFCNLWLFEGLILKVLPKLNATAGGMVGTTCNFQKIQGSTNEKICTAEAMLRNINEQDLEQDLAAFQAVAEKYGITVEVTYQEYYPPVELDHPGYRYTMECLAKVFPRYPAAPYILPAGTDAWKLTPVCDCVIRHTPTRMRSNQLGSIHGAEENIDVAAIYEAAEFYKHFVRNYR